MSRRYAEEMPPDTFPTMFTCAVLPEAVSAQSEGQMRREVKQDKTFEINPVGTLVELKLIGSVSVCGLLHELI